MCSAGTHLYVLYESYGYSVASLYCLGFLTGGFMSPITGPMVDRIGRKKAAMLYCLLEMFINGLEQYPYLPGLIASRMIGGFTTNLLCQVFETWLDTEYRLRGLEKKKYEIIMRDSVIVSNLAAIFSGYLAHVLAEWYGATGPFRGAVCCTGMALSVVGTLWTENYGSQEGDEVKHMFEYFREAVAAFRADSRMLRVGAVQGLTAGSIQIFIFLWAPALRELSRTADASTAGLDSHGEPAYGLIFGAFMAAGVFGGVLAPLIRRAVSCVLSPIADSEDDSLEIVEVDGEEVEVRPMAVEFLAAFCYMVSALLLLVPFVFTGEAGDSFAVCLAAFLAFELLIGVFLPCEGVIRSLYFPATARASVMSLPRIIVNGAVSVGVASTNFIRYVGIVESSCIVVSLPQAISLVLVSLNSLETAFAAVATMMLISAFLQLSLISSREWSSLWSRIVLASHQASTLFPLQFPSSDATKVKRD
jgi:MFS transporter, MFS domain-containing protein family, molybdate-anion transporter